jgi:hypothetical protein
LLTSIHRKTLNLVLLMVVLPSLLLGILIVNHLSPPPTNPNTSSLEFNAPLSREVGASAPDALAQALRQGLSVGADAQLSPVPPYTSLIGNLGLIMTLTAVVLAMAVGCTMLRNPDGVGSPLRTRPLGKREGFPPKDEAAKEVSQRLVAIQESVRRDMADYLHGYVQSKLVALSASLGMCQQILDRDPLAAPTLWNA